MTPDELDPALEALLAEEATATGPSPQVKARLLQRIHLSVAPVAPPPSAGPGPVAAPGFGLAKPLLLGLAGLGLAGAVAVQLLPRGQSPQRAVEPPAVAVAAPAPARAVPAPLPPAPLKAPPRQSPRAPAPLPAPAPRPSTLSAERALLDAARAALGAGQVATGLEKVRAHERAFMGGQLAEEREVLWIQLSRAEGDVEAAKARADEFRRRHPESILRPAVDALAPPR